MKLNCKFYKNKKNNYSVIFNKNRNDDVVIPMGPGEPTKVNNGKGFSLNYNEYIVYDTKQVQMRYLIKIKFLFK